MKSLLRSFICQWTFCSAIFSTQRHVPLETLIVLLRKKKEKYQNYVAKKNVNKKLMSMKKKVHGFPHKLKCTTNSFAVLISLNI